LVAIMVADELDDGWSAVYSFFEPDLAARSLGTFMILRLIELSQQRTLPYVYLGYYIKDCGKMNYKLNFSPCQQYRDKKWGVSQAS
jgi:arginyl-tRNA--protein-N-Asp/Glu arginylyltransferase